MQDLRLRSIGNRELYLLVPSVPPPTTRLCPHLCKDDRYYRDAPGKLTNRVLPAYPGAGPVDP